MKIKILILLTALTTNSVIAKKTKINTSQKAHIVPIFKLGTDFGGEEFVPGLTTSAGYNTQLGLSLNKKMFSTQLLFGYKMNQLIGDYNTLEISRFTINLLEKIKIKKISVAAGINYHFYNNIILSEGSKEIASISFKPSLGAVIELSYSYNKRQSIALRTNFMVYETDYNTLSAGSVGVYWISEFGKKR